jgi:ectoine hydroxylase-related dioxygenase (phytanoyl-CoA dioxygenase family)
VRLDARELQNQKLSAEHHAEATRDLEVLGYVVLEGVIGQEKVEALRTAFFALLEENHRRLGDNRGKQRQGGVPLSIEEPFDDPAVLANPLALGVFGDLLQEDLICSYFSSDTGLPGSQYQPAHRDGKALFPGLPVTVPPYMYEVNIPLVDFREDNGPTEIWPMSHRISDVNLAAPDALERGFAAATETEIQRYVSGLNPQAVIMPAGSLLLRDPRMWHRGTPNNSDQPRPMLSLAYHFPWYRFNSVSVRGEVYEAWPEYMQRIFRLATIDGRTSIEFA